MPIEQFPSKFSYDPLATVQLLPAQYAAGGTQQLVARHRIVDAAPAAIVPGQFPGARAEMSQGQRAIVRQVQLLCDGQPWIYARTVIPVTSLRGRLRRLAHLGTRPLGGMLFADRGMRRGTVQLARIRAGQALYVTATSGLQPPPAEIWGRRSVFRIAGKPLLVSELFLPGFPAAGASRPLWKSR